MGLSLQSDFESTISLRDYCPKLGNQDGVWFCDLLHLLDRDKYLL